VVSTSPLSVAQFAAQPATHSTLGKERTFFRLQGEVKNPADPQSNMLSTNDVRRFGRNPNKDYEDSKNSNAN
jgi:hypothetical protein